MSSNKPAEFLIRCPQCDQPSNAIKIFRFPVIIFLLVFFYVFRWTKAACPSCQRKNIGYFALINLPAMHLLWPFVCLPVMLYFLVRTFIPGHSADVHDYLQLRR